MNVKEPASHASINCPIDLFPRQEAEIVRLTELINRARSAVDKAPLAELLIQAVDVLLACQAYDDRSVDCHLCHEFSQLRRKTAAIIVAAARFPVRRRQ
jgi:hypothetical protein